MPRRERIFESGQKDFGVSSEAHKFACELRALLASDKHLGSAERSERQLPKPNTPASAGGTVADYYYLNALRAYTATVPMTQYDVPEVSRRFRPHLPLHFAIQISEK